MCDRHIETVPDDTLCRFAELGVVASVQPTHCCDFTVPATEPAEVPLLLTVLDGDPTHRAASL
ncbi:hypothetical protein [Streptomyces pactum]|uniref:Uncharacterized protein n=1 Tax=Streptomyces pactum TaxID=68249 RepID=A0A1S6J2G2_9ACTN|nr:hypothetical protein [Streptomyces pactum]AQS65931.1 hypothetical protein B1H29_02360 [Streptomyces pactum]